MAMVVTSIPCGSIFRLYENLLRDAKGASILCRKCGDFIMARDPEVPPFLKASPADSIISRVFVGTPGDWSSLTREERIEPGPARNIKFRPRPHLPLPFELAAQDRPKGRRGRAILEVSLRPTVHPDAALIPSGAIGNMPGYKVLRGLEVTDNAAGKRGPVIPAGKTLTFLGVPGLPVIRFRSAP